MHSSENCETSTAIKGEAELSSSGDKYLWNYRRGFKWCQHKDVSLRSSTSIPVSCLAPANQNAQTKNDKYNSESHYDFFIRSLPSFIRQEFARCEVWGDLEEKTMRGHPAQNDYYYDTS